MFGKLLGAVVSAPVRLLNVPVKMAQKAAQAADEFMLGKSRYSYEAPRKNALDRVADTISDSCEEAMDD